MVNGIDNRNPLQRRLHKTLNRMPLGFYTPVTDYIYLPGIAINFIKRCYFCEIRDESIAFFTKRCYFCEKQKVIKMRQSIEKTIKNRIIEHGHGWCFTPMHFSDLGSDASIRKALSQLTKQSIIRRLAQGVYDYPKMHVLLGTIPPDLNEVAKAIAEKNGVQIQPAGALAANLVGLSAQVPGRIIFLTEGPSRKVKIGNQEIIFRKTSKKIMSSAGTREGLLIQALKNVGKDHIDRLVRAQVLKFLKDSNEKEIRENMKFAPAWIRAIIFEIMGLKP